VDAVAKRRDPFDVTNCSVKFRFENVNCVWLAETGSSGDFF